MKKDRVVIIGSTGSIGTQSIDVIKTVGDKKIVALACKSNVKKLFEQVKLTGVKLVAIYDEDKAVEFRDICSKNKISVKVLTGMDGLLKLATLKDADMVVISVVGMIGIRPTIEAVKAKKIVCLANKESLVCAGDIIMPLVRKYKVDLRPIDSEHSAIWQCLQGEKESTVKKVIITASGGPFYGRKREELKNIKVEDALKHPNWSMGKKITIDSSTLVNKGLEVMEAHHLFNMLYDKIDVVVQRESIIHSMVLFVDGAVKAELGVPSMRIPIEYALYKENRKFINENEIDWTKLDKISIGTPDLKTFKGLALAYEAIRLGGLMPSVYNALNEVAVKNFLDKKINYLEIVDFIEKGMKVFNKKKLNKKKFTIEDVESTMCFAKELFGKLHK
ncbi:MAG: 1-deoxy-D-xylulose-5-phosphate reductoisomerase [Lachnospiraceae bacterium]|nr:1-deoxy-D-xylulose-5-phosphate reductoisomerase [Lachnospiraceae bacterium]